MQITVEIPDKLGKQFNNKFKKNERIKIIQQAVKENLNKGINNVIHTEFVEIKTLIDSGYELIKPIKVKIIKNNNEVIGDIEELEIYSFGESEFEVLRDLNEEITDLFDDLIKLNDKNLGKYPRKWKAILKKYIRKTRWVKKKK